METLNSIIQKMEACIQDNDDLETVMMDCMEEMEENYNQLDSVQLLLRLMERHPLADFGSPGPIVHFVERFYKKGYEEELLLSLKRMPTLHTVWMLHRLINGTDQAESLFRSFEGNFLKMHPAIRKSEKRHCISVDLLKHNSSKFTFYTKKFSEE